MPSEIGSSRRRENSVKFVGSRPRKEGADRPLSVVTDSSKHYAVDRELSPVGQCRTGRLVGITHLVFR